jgi:tetratricopeptide (TPR) repeat protein
MPYSEVGVVKNATKEAILNVEYKGSTAEIKLYVTSPFDNIKIELVTSNQVLFSEEVSSTPETPFLKQVAFGKEINPATVTARVTDLISGKRLVSYQQEEAPDHEVPPAAQAAKEPGEIESTEQLYLTGLHLEQYRHATYAATHYYREALRRDPTDTRNNNAMGLWLLRRGQFKAAEPYFRAAVKTLTQRNPNPYNGEAYYNLGWSLKLQGRNEEAFASFYKSVWNDAWQHAGYLNLARIAAGNKNFEQALELIERSLVRNYHSHTARHLKAVLLRKQGSIQEAAALIDESLDLDPFNFGCLFEKNILYRNKNQKLASQAKEQLCRLSRNWVHNYIEYAFDYAHAGLYDEAIEFFEVYLAHTEKPYTMVFYYIGWFESRRGNEQKCNEYYRKAASMPADYCFPNRIEDVIVLEEVKRANTGDAHAPYLLGNFWYDRRQYKEAVACWERSVQIDDSFPTAHRNLSLAYYNKLNDPQKALAALEKAFSLDTADARVLMELDQLYKKLNKPHRERLSFLETYLHLVESRDDLYLERVMLYNHLEAYQTAKDLLAEYKFHPWEGGEGKVVGQHLLSCIELAKLALASGNAQTALELLDEAGHYPENLGEGKLSGAQENDIFYLKGLAYEKAGDAETARSFFMKATQGMAEPVQAIFYNDPQPDKIFYQGLAWFRLGEKHKAIQIFNRLIDFGKNHMSDKVHIDYFAVSLPDLLVFDADLDLRNKIHCLYLQGLGYLGLGHVHIEKAERLFDEVLKLDINHSGAIIHKRMRKYLFIIEP